jgi:preprotein translocase subunit YajC
MKRLKDELEETRELRPGDRVRTPDGYFGVVEAVESTRIIVKDEAGQTRWHYPLGMLTLAPPKEEG